MQDSAPGSLSAAGSRQKALEERLGKETMFGCVTRYRASPTMRAGSGAGLVGAILGRLLEPTRNPLLYQSAQRAMGCLQRNDRVTSCWLLLSRRSKLECGFASKAPDDVVAAPTPDRYAQNLILQQHCFHTTVDAETI